LTAVRCNNSSKTVIASGKMTLVGQTVYLPATHLPMLASSLASRCQPLRLRKKLPVDLMVYIFHTRGESRCCVK
jgi:hypothetical protein